MELTAKEYFTQKGKDMVQKRNERLTPEQRSKIASKAGKTGWDKLTDKQKKDRIKKFQMGRDRYHKARKSGILNTDNNLEK